MESLYAVSRFVYGAMPELHTLLLFALLSLALYIILQAQRPAVDGQPAPYWSSVLQDDQGKVSALRVATLIALAVHSAIILYMVTNVVTPREVASKDALDALFPHVILYAALWSGAAVVSKALDVFAARLAK